MIKPDVHKYRYKMPHVCLWLACLVLVAGGSLGWFGPRPQVAGGDKLMHFAAYLVLGYLFPRPLIKFRHYLTVWLGLSAIGAFLEFLQWGFIRAGIGDPLDALANSLGAGLGLVLFKYAVNRS
ncbi:MAG: hypothetical protein ACQES5_02390 [Thermodesulfobacteriota bacterium]